MLITSLISLVLFFIPSKADDDPPSSDWKNGTFYTVTPNCFFISAISISDIQTQINNFNSIFNDWPCENIASAVYQNSKGNHLIIIKYESAKEISVMIWQINGSTSLNLKDSFKKINYEYMLGDYCSFDKTLLSIGINSNMLYTTVKCDGDTWAFMRSILTLDGNFYTSSGPLIYFKNGDSSFDRLLFLSTYREINNENSFDDSLVLRYTIKEDAASGSKISYLATFLHQLNGTENNFGTQNIASAKNIYFSTTFIKFAVIEMPDNKAEIKFFTHKHYLFSTLSTFMDSYIEGFRDGNDAKIIVNKDPTFIHAFGYCFNFESDQPLESITWKIRDTERISNYKAEDCSVEYEKEEEQEECQDKFQSKKVTYVFAALYYIAGAELILLLGTLAALIGIIVLVNKKSKKHSNNVVDEANVTFLGRVSTKDD